MPMWRGALRVPLWRAPESAHVEGGSESTPVEASPCASDLLSQPLSLPQARTISMAHRSPSTSSPPPCPTCRAKPPSRCQHARLHGETRVRYASGRCSTQRVRNAAKRSCWVPLAAAPLATHRTPWLTFSKHAFGATSSVVVSGSSSLRSSSSSPLIQATLPPSQMHSRRCASEGAQVSACNPESCTHHTADTDSENLIGDDERRENRET